MSEIDAERQLEDILMEVVAEPEEPEPEDETDDTPQGEEVVADADGDTSPPEGADATDDEEGTQDDEELDDEESNTADEESGDLDSDAEPPPSENPAVLALLDRYDGDKDKALLGYIETEKIISRQGLDNRRLTERMMQLEAQIEQMQMFSQAGPAFLSPEQQEWIDEAVGSEQTMAYVQQAIQVGELALARSLVEVWGQEQPFPAMRAGTIIDRAEEYMRRQQQETLPIDHSRLLETIAGAYPDLPSYEHKIVDVMANLGENHPLVAAARSSSPEEAVQGIVGLYEIARAQEATVRSTKDQIKQRQRENGDRARRDAVVSSGGTAPASTQAPRSKEIMPGLTMDALVAEMDQ